MPSPDIVNLRLLISMSKSGEGIVIGYDVKRSFLQWLSRSDDCCLKLKYKVKRDVYDIGVLRLSCKDNYEKITSNGMTGTDIYSSFTNHFPHFQPP